MQHDPIALFVKIGHKASTVMLVLGLLLLVVLGVRATRAIRDPALVQGRPRSQAVSPESFTASALFVPTTEQFSVTAIPQSQKPEPKADPDHNEKSETGQLKSNDQKQSEITKELPDYSWHRAQRQ
jgi:hypothetical protein